MADKCKLCGRELSDAQTAPPGENGVGGCSSHSASGDKTAAALADGQSRKGFFSRENNTMGLLGFIASIVSLTPPFFILIPVALGLSLAGLSKKPRTLAIAGCIISGLGVAVGVVALICTFLYT